MVSAMAWTNRSETQLVVESVDDARLWLRRARFMHGLWRELDWATRRRKQGRSNLTGTEQNTSFDMAMGIADVATILFSQYLNIDVKKPDWPDRDRFVLSAGHGSMLIYALNYLLGYADMNVESLKNFRQLNSNTHGHHK